MSVYAFYFGYVMLVMQCGINHLEFKLMLCPFHNLVLLSTVKLSYGLTSVGTNWATWQIVRGKVCVTITHYNFKRS